MKESIGKRKVLYDYKSRLTPEQINKFIKIFGQNRYDTYEETVYHMTNKDVEGAIGICQRTEEKNEKEGVYVKQSFKELGLDGLI